MPDISALYINCSLKRDGADSHTMRLIKRSEGIMRREGVDTEIIHAMDHRITFGMEKDLSTQGVEDDWPSIQEKIMAADILVIGSPIWLGQKSSVSTLVTERMYAYSGDRNDKDQYAYYGKTAGCLITGNEDGIKHCAMDILYGLQHIGYTIPPQADAGWVGEAGPGPSYGDETGNGRAGYDNDFTNRNTTFMTWNLIHMARLLKANGGIPAEGNQADSWQSAANAMDFEPDTE